MLSFSRLAGSEIADEHFPVAIDNGKIIYYHDLKYNKLDDLDECELTQLVDDAVEELMIEGLDNKKLTDLENKIKNGIRPTHPESLKIYCHIMEKLATEESKYHDPYRKSISLCPTCIPEQVDTIFIAGGNGVGKSFLASKFAQNYRLFYPENRIFIFRAKSFDKSYDGKIEGLIKPKLNRVFLKTLLPRRKKDDSDDEESEGEQEVEKDLQDDAYLDDYRNSLIIFDEINIINDKDIRAGLLKFKDNVLQLGRSYGISVISIQHKALGGPETLKEFTECKTIIMYPKRARLQAKDILIKLKFPDKIIENMILNDQAREERWLALIMPNILVTENYVKVLKY